MVAKLVHVRGNVVPMEFHPILNRIKNLIEDLKIDYFNLLNLC